MGLAFEMALVALRLADRGDLANEVLARKIMDLAKAGERDPNDCARACRMSFARRRRQVTSPAMLRRGRRSKSFRNGVAAVA